MSEAARLLEQATQAVALGQAEDLGHAPAQLVPAQPFGAGQVIQAARRAKDERRHGTRDRFHVDRCAVLVGEETEGPAVL